MIDDTSGKTGQDTVPDSPILEIRDNILPAEDDTGLDVYNTLLLGYAAGTLNQAQDLIVSAHISMSPTGKALVQAYENIGGTIIETECEPVDMCDRALDHVLSCIDEKIEGEDVEECKQALHEKFGILEGIDLPEPLESAIHDFCSCTRWKSRYPGLKAIELPLACKESKARIIKTAPAFQTPEHSHHGLEITLILDGAFSDDSGTYRRGDLIVTDDHIQHAPKSCPETGCVCMTVTSAPLKFTSNMGRVLNRLLRF